MSPKSLLHHLLPCWLVFSGVLLDMSGIIYSSIAYSQTRFCDIGSLPVHPANYKLRGSVLLKKDQFQEALNCFETALQDERGQKDPELWNNHGLALAGLKRFDEALSSYNKALQIKPGGKFVDRVQPPVQAKDYYMWWFNQGSALVDLNRYDEAIASFDKSLQIKSDDGFVWYFRGLALFRLDRYEEARISYRRSILKSPENSYTIKFKTLFSNQDYVLFYGEAEAMASLRRYRDAIQAFERGKKIRRSNPEIKFFQNNNIDESTYETYIEGIRLIDQKDYTKALVLFDQLTSSNPNYASAWDAKADTLVALKRYPEAIAAYNRAIETESDPFPSWYKKGNALQELQRDVEALQAYQKAIDLSLSEGFAEVWHNRGLILFNQKKYEEAISSYSRSLKAKTLWGGIKRVDTEYSLAVTLYKAKRYRDSSFAVEKILKEQPDYKEALELRNLLKKYL